jgi:hypothetical protein
MSSDTVWEYVTSPSGLVHLRQLAPPRWKAICGRVVREDWVVGDETTSGRTATCATCQDGAQ